MHPNLVGKDLRVAGCSSLLAHNDKSFTTRMICEVRAQQVFNSVRWRTFPAEKSLRSRCVLPIRRNRLLSRRNKSATLSSLDFSQPDLSEKELDRRLNKAVGLINTADLLAPFDRSSYSAPLVIWSAVFRKVHAVSVETSSTLFWGVVAGKPYQIFLQPVGQSFLAASVPSKVLTHDTLS